MKTILTSSKLIPLVLGLFLAVRLVSASGSPRASGIQKTDGRPVSGMKVSPKVLADADSTAILGLFGMATAATGVIKPKKGVKKAS